MQFRKPFSLQRSSIHAPVSHNHSFKPSIMDWILPFISGVTEFSYQSKTSMTMVPSCPSPPCQQNYRLHLLTFFASFKLGTLFREAILTFQISLHRHNLLDAVLKVSPIGEGLFLISVKPFADMIMIISHFPRQTRDLWEQDILKRTNATIFWS